MRGRTGCALLGAAAAAAAAGTLLFVWVAGLVVVRDRTGEVVAAIVVNDLREQRLHRLPGGWFVGIPSLEGEVEVRCSDGSSDRAGYVTGSLHTRIVVEGGLPGAACQARED